jgi:hypothetical protein
MEEVSREMEDVCALVRLERCKIEDIKAMEKEGLFETVRLLRTARELNDGMIDHSLEELIHKTEDGPYVRRETRCEIMQIADAFRAKRRRAIGTLIGASANAITAGLTEREGHSFNDPLEGFLKVGLPIMLVSILVGWIYILIGF